MSHETATPSSSRSKLRPTLPPFLHLTAARETCHPSNQPGASKLDKKSLTHFLHQLVFRRRFGMVHRLERAAEATMEDRNAVRNAGTSNPVKRKTTRHPTSRPSTSSGVSPSIALHVSTPRTPRTLTTSFPPLNVSDIPPRSPTNKSLFSAVLLAGGDEECDEDDPALAQWHTEQVHRARLAKLTRHLGEEIPAELVTSPAFLSNESFHPSPYGGYHHKHRSLDPSSLKQESFTKEILRGSKSLKEVDKTYRTLSVVGIPPEVPITERVACVAARHTETTIDMVPVPNPAPSQRVTHETCHSNSQMSTPNNGILHEGVSTDTYPGSLLSHSCRPFADTCADQLFLRTPRAPRKLHRRPSTADGGRHVEKLANFFGVGPDNVSASTQAHEAAQRLQILPTTALAAGDLAMGIHHAPKSQLDVAVKVSKPSRFWNGARATTRYVHPEDVLDELRMMRAS